MRAAGVDREGLDALPFDDLDAARARLRDQVGVEVLAAHDLDGTLEHDVGRGLPVDQAAGPTGDTGHAHRHAQLAQRLVGVPGEPASARLGARESRAVETEDAPRQRRLALHQRQRRGDAGRTGAGDQDIQKRK